MQKYSYGVVNNSSDDLFSTTQRLLDTSLTTQKTEFFLAQPNRWPRWQCKKGVLFLRWIVKFLANVCYNQILFVLKVILPEGLDYRIRADLLYSINVDHFLVHCQLSEKDLYRIVTSSNMSRLEAHAGIFRLLI